MNNTATFAPSRLTTPQAAEFLGVKGQTLNNWRHLGKGPSFIRMGKIVRYDRDALEQYVESATVNPQV